MRFTHIALFSLIFSAIISGCNLSGSNNESRNNNWENKHSGSPDVNRQILQVQETIKRLYSTNPDSAIHFYLNIIDLYKHQQMHYNTFDAYIKISELYCYRKNDWINAVYYYGEALKTMQKNGGVEDSDSFFYIDMGNMFYMNKIFPQAQKSYDKAIEIAALNNDSFAISVALNNKALVYREGRDFNSSLSFLRKSLAIRKKITPLYEAHNYLYIANVFTFLETADSIVHYRELTLEALKRHSQTSVDTSIITETAAKALADGFYIRESELMAKYYQKNNNTDEAIRYYQIALQRSRLANDHELAMRFLYNIAELYDHLNLNNQAVKYATSAYQLALKHHNFEYSINSSKLLNRLFNLTGNLSKANFYLTEVITYTDSLKQRESSEKIQTAKILLITNQIEDSVRYYQVQASTHGKVVKAQSFSIVLLVSLLILTIVILIYILRKRVQLKKEHLKQMAAFLNNLEKEEKDRKQRKVEGINDLYNELEEKLVNLMKFEKVFLQKNITLAGLADMLGTNVTYLSQYINNQLKTNFNDYINSQRIKEACRLFRDNTTLKYTVDQVADRVGFSSRTTFYTTFKKFTGITPSFFQKYILTPEVQYLDEPVDVQ